MYNEIKELIETSPTQDVSWATLYKAFDVPVAERNAWRVSARRKAPSWLGFNTSRGRNQGGGLFIQPDATVTLRDILQATEVWGPDDTPVTLDAGVIRHLLIQAGAAQ